MTPPAVANLFELPERFTTEEVFEQLASGQNLRIERIISTGQTTPAGEWYDQTRSEWVGLLQGTAKLEYANGQVQQLSAGDWVLIPARYKHRVAYTSETPPCIWLAIHGDISRL